jgi:O-antigen ligase
VGTTLAVSAVITLSLLIGRAPGRPWSMAAVLAVLLAGLGATWARAAWLGAAAGVVTLMTLGVDRRVRLALALLTLLLVGLGAVLLPRWPAVYAEVRSIGSLEANKNRIAIWRAVPKMIGDHPVVGTGFGTFGLAYPQYRLPDSPDLMPPFAHNLLLNAAVEMGMFGLVAIVAVCAVGLASSWRWMTRSPRGSPERTVAATVLAALVALLANQLVDGTVMSVHVGFGFFALLALGAVGDRYLSPLRA